MQWWEALIATAGTGFATAILLYGLFPIRAKARKILVCLLTVMVIAGGATSVILLLPPWPGGPTHSRSDNVFIVAVCYVASFSTLLAFGPILIRRKKKMSAQ